MMESSKSPSSGPSHLSTKGSETNWTMVVHSAVVKSNHSLTFHQHFHSGLLGVSLGLLSLVTVIMNVLVLCAVKKERSLHTVGNLYIVSLSVADLIVGTIVMPLNLMYLLQDQWKLGHAVCLFWLIMDYVASTASIFSLFILCLDRYRSIRQPLKYLKYRTWGKASAMITGAWLLAMLWIVPILGWRFFTHVELKPEEENQCDTDFRFVTWFKIVTAIFNFYVPSVLMLWFYRYIYMAVRQHLKDRGRIIHPTNSFEENKNGQNAHTAVSKHKVPQNGCGNAKELSKKLCQFDRQTYPSGDGDKTRKVSSRCHRKIGVKGQQTSLLAIKGGELRVVQKVKSCSLTPEEKPQDVMGSTGNAEARLPGPSHDDHVSGPKPLRGVCAVSRVSDMQVKTCALYSTHAAPWTEEDEVDRFEPAYAKSLKQTWQKFIGQSCHRIQSLKIHKEYKAAKQLGFIISAFFLCWIPYFITFMVMAFCRECVHHELHMFTIWLGYINSTLNPFIYPLCNGKFKRVFKHFFKIPVREAEKRRELSPCLTV